MNILKQLKGLATDTTKGSGSTETWYITAERAEGIRDKDRWSRSDPYLKIEFGGKHVRTRTINNDRTPYWNETFQFQLSSGNSKDIHLTLMDDDIGLDDKIGTATISKADLPLISGEEKYIKIPVLHKEQMSGLVHLRIKKIDNSLNSSSNRYSQQMSSNNYQQQQQQQQQMPSQQSHYPNLSQQQQQQQQPPNIPFNQYSGYNNNNNNSSNYNNMPPPSYNSQSYYNTPSSYNVPPPQYNMPYNNNNYQQGPYQGQMPPMNQPQQQQQQQQQPYMNVPQTNYYPNSHNNYGDQYQQRRY